MPFDGILLKSIVYELKTKLIGGRIEKIYQPEKDEIVLSVRSNSINYKLLLCSDPSIPRVHLTVHRKENPAIAPNFCMILRKYIQGAKIIAIESFGFERILAIDIETYTELHDIQIQRLIIEIMGKHSNIILINANNKIIDSIKHVDIDISRFREVMPARNYVLPPVQNKFEPNELHFDKLFSSELLSEKKVATHLLDNIMGTSPFLTKIICKLSNVDPNTLTSNLSANELLSLKETIETLICKLKNNEFSPCLIFDSENVESPTDFYCFNFYDTSDSKSFNSFVPKTFATSYAKSFQSINCTADEFYCKKDIFKRLKSKKSDLMKSIENAIEKNIRKINIYNENILEVSERENYKLYGDLILAFIHSIPKNKSKVILSNFYSDNCEDIEVPLDPKLSPQTTASKYYKKYTKSKNTFESCSKLLVTSKEEFLYLESVKFTLDNSVNDAEIDEIRQEVISQGIITPKLTKNKLKTGKNKAKSAKIPPTSKPHLFKSSDGYLLFVGKNNYQNDRLTLKESSSNDTWLHTKDIAGSHVIIKKQKDEIPATTLYEAAQLAAYFSNARQSSNVPVDYTKVKFVKKPSGSKPGRVIYTEQKTIFVTPSQDLVDKIKFENEDVKKNDS